MASDSRRAVRLAISSESSASAPTAATPTDAVEGGADEAEADDEPADESFDDPARREQGIKEESSSSDEEEPNGDSAQSRIQYGAEAAACISLNAIFDATDQLEEGQADREENARAAALVMKHPPIRGS